MDEDYPEGSGLVDQFTLYPESHGLSMESLTQSSIIIISSTNTPPHHCNKKE